MDEETNYQKPRKWGTNRESTTSVSVWSLRDIEIDEVEYSGTYKHEVFFPSEQNMPIAVNLN